MSKWTRIFLFGVLVLLLIVGTSCASRKDVSPEKNEKPFEVEALSALLPEEGYEWIYNGFAEYGHRMKLDTISQEEKKKTYQISGKVFDMSDGESKLNLDLTIQYIIEENRLVQVKEEEAMLDSKFDRITLIQTPLVAGNSWVEQVTDKEGKTATIKAEIQEVRVSDGVKTYKVHYQEQESDYWEERVIKEGIGVVSLEKLMDLGGEKFTVGYYLFSDTGEKEISLKLYFPNQDATKVIPEERTVLITDAGIARVTMEELIKGPQDSRLSRAIPEGTKLLNIKIEDNICYVNFSAELRDKHWGGSAGETMTIGAIVNTLTEFPGIQQVQILIEGKVGESIGGHLELDQPLSRIEYIM